MFERGSFDCGHTAAEAAVRYRMELGTTGNTSGSGRESDIIDACLHGFLPRALCEIARWRHVWAPVVAPEFDPMVGPEIGLVLKETSRGNLDVIWVPIMTQEQHDRGIAEHPEFARWILTLGHQEVPLRRKEQLLFLRGFTDLAYRIERPAHGGIMRKDAIEAMALEMLFSELAGRLSHLVQAHWQSVLVIEKERNHRPQQVPISMHVESAWSYRSRKARMRRDLILASIGIDEAAFHGAWNKTLASSRLKSDAGLCRALSSKLGCPTKRIASLKSAIDEIGNLGDKEPDLWWNRESVHPHPVC